MVINSNKWVWLREYSLQYTINLYPGSSCVFASKLFRIDVDTAKTLHMDFTWIFFPTLRLQSDSFPKKIQSFSLTCQLVVASMH